MDLKEETGYSTIGITDDGTSNGILLGVVTGRDYRPNKDSLTKKLMIL
jgi:IMP dehydrogenase